VQGVSQTAAYVIILKTAFAVNMFFLFFRVLQIATPGKVTADTPADLSDYRRDFFFCKNLAKFWCFML